MALSGLKIYNNTDDYNFNREAYKLGLSKCEFKVEDEKSIDYAKNGNPMASYSKRTYMVEIQSVPFLKPTNFVNVDNMEADDEISSSQAKSYSTEMVKINQYYEQMKILYPDNTASIENLRQTKIEEAKQYALMEALYNKYHRENMTGLIPIKSEYSKLGLYTYLRKRRFFSSVQGVFPPAYGDFVGTFKVINSTESANYGIIEGTIHLCID